MFLDYFKDKRVLVTGHTGFKGSWLCEWLLDLGAQVTGLSLPPPAEPALFNQLGLSERLNHTIGDIRELATVRSALAACRPHVVFHLAAQPLVRLSYDEPLDTYATNFMGTVHMLESLRLANEPCTAIMVTTDKCYANREWVHSYREDDAMGGNDPYSSSKGAAELAINAYRRSYFSPSEEHFSVVPGIRLASARAGNVIGGGDWAQDRIMPDCIQSLTQGKAIRIRNARSTRPWQHVLEPLSGYLWLAARLALSDRLEHYSRLDSSFNFGPALTSNRTVGNLVQEVLKHWQGTWEHSGCATQAHEAQLLNLATDKAYHYLQWQPIWDFERAVAETVSWYRACHNEPKAVPQITRRQISQYIDDAKKLKAPWLERDTHALMDS